MMTASMMAGSGRAGALLLAPGAAAGPGGRGLGLAALVSWLFAELLGLYMLRSWIAGGGVRDRHAIPDGLSPALIAAHAGLAFAGLTSWSVFLATGSPVPAWLGIGFLAPAIGLGISTVTIWTPYPARRPPARAGASGQPGQPDQGAGVPAVLVTNEMLDRALADETLTRDLVDDLVVRMLAAPAPPPAGRRSWQLAPVIPVLHGVAALVTFLLAMLAAVATLGAG